MIDFLIVGGGIAGVSAAARLSSLGSVTLLEAEDALGYHASGRSAAMFEESYGNGPVRALNAASADDLRDKGVLSPRGVVFVARPEQEAAYQRAIGDSGLRVLTPEDAVAQVPILKRAAVGFALLSEDAQDIDTDRLLQSFAQEARSKGAVFETGSPVDRIVRTSGGWQVFSGDRIWDARHLVNAGGAWADLVARMAGLPKIGLIPYRRSMARLPAPGGHDVTGWPMILGIEEDWYAKPDAGAWLVSPAEEDPSEPMDAWADDMVIAEGLARYEAMVTEPVTRVTTTWAGLRTFAPDRALVLGPDPLEPRFLWAAGQGGYGMQTACAASLLLAELVGGVSAGIGPTDVAALRPDRFRRNPDGNPGRR